MSKMYKLSNEQLKYYDDNGFVVIKGLFDLTSLYAYKKRFQDIAKGIVENGPVTSVVREPSLVAKGLKGEDVINKLQDIHFDDIFMTYTEDPKLISVISQFIGHDIRVTNSMLINKPPGASEHPTHQDLAYFPFRPVDKIIASWTAIDHVSEENGALYVIPGSHKPGILYEHGQKEGAMKLYHGILDESFLKDKQKVSVEMTPGDTIFFHPLIVHGSGANISKNYRKSITAHYASENCYYIDIQGGPQERVARDVEAEAKRRGIGMSFTDVWRYKSKHVDVAISKL